MSWEASTYVLGQKVGSATRKLVLMGYANHASKDGRDAFPSLDTVADYAECDKRTVQRHVKALVEEGWMREGDQRLVAHRRADQRPIVYDLAMSSEERERWQIEHQAGANARREAASAAGTLGAQVRAEKKAAEGQTERRDEMSPRDLTSTPDVGGDKMSRRPGAERGDIPAHDGVTSQAERGDTGVTQTVQEPSLGTTQEPLPTPDGVSADEAKRISSSAEKIARWWVDVHDKRAPVLDKQRTFMALRQQYVKAALVSGYTEQQVQAALQSAAEILPSKAKWRLALAAAAGGVTPIPRRGYDNRQWDEQAVADTAALGTTQEDLQREFGLGGSA